MRKVLIKQRLRQFRFRAEEGGSEANLAFPSTFSRAPLTLHQPLTRPIVANPNPPAVNFNRLIPSPSSFSLYRAANPTSKPMLPAAGCEKSERRGVGRQRRKGVRVQRSRTSHPLRPIDQTLQVRERSVRGWG